MLFGMTRCAASISKEPFKDLKASEISFATVCLTPPNKTLEITNLKELTEYLKSIIIYKNVRCWSEAQYPDLPAKSQKVSVDGYRITLKPDGYVYEVKAEWNKDSGYGDIAYYSFYAKTSGKQELSPKSHPDQNL